MNVTVIKYIGFKFLPTKISGVKFKYADVRNFPCLICNINIHLHIEERKFVVWNANF